MSNPTQGAVGAETMTAGKIREALKEIQEAANDMLISLPDHWHDDATIRLTDAANDARTALSVAEQDDLYDLATPAQPAGAAPDSLRELLDAVRPFYACVFNDNGDVSISTGNLTDHHWLALGRAFHVVNATHSAGQSELPILRAVIEVHPDRTDTRLSFGRGVKHETGAEAVKQAIAALQAEFDGRQGCPASTEQSAGSGVDLTADEIRRTATEAKSPSQDPAGERIAGYRHFNDGIKRLEEALTRKLSGKPAPVSTRTGDEGAEGRIAALQQVTAERDEARDFADRRLDLMWKQGEHDPDRDAILVAAVQRVRELSAALATANTDLARLRAEGEAKGRALREIESQSRRWIRRDRISPNDVIVRDDGRHFKVLALNGIGRIAHAATAREK